MHAFSELNQCKYIPYLRLDIKTKQKHLLICAVHYVAKETQKTEKKDVIIVSFSWQRTKVAGKKEMWPIVIGFYKINATF